VSDEEVTPRLFDHTVRVYEEMLKRSTKQPIQVEGADDQMANVYEGHLTTLFSDLSIANPYYTKIVDMLKGQNCMVQIRRGGGVALSKWVLLTPPTEEGFRQIMDRKRAPKGKAHILEQQVKGLQSMVNDLTDRVERLEKVQ
jgi:hypothetical protein